MRTMFINLFSAYLKRIKLFIYENLNFASKAKVKKLQLKVQNLQAKVQNLEKAMEADIEKYETYVLNPKKETRDKKRKEPLRRVIIELLDKKPFPLFFYVQIETINRCNSDCDFCPVNYKDDTREFAKMPEEIFYSIIKQLKDLDYSGYICLYDNNEPLLDKRIFDFVEYAKRELPKATHFLFTNGLLLNLEKFKRLIACLDYLLIDNYYEGEKKIHPHLIEIAEYCLNSEELMKKTKIQLTNKHAIRNSRAGGAKNRNNIIKIESACLWPFVQICISPSGQLSLCCNDALHLQIMGDATKESLVDIWRSDQYMKYRRKILESRQNIEICASCDTFGLIDISISILSDFKLGDWKEVKKMMTAKNNGPSQNSQ